MLTLATEVEHALASAKKGQDAGRALRKLLDDAPKPTAQQQFRALWHPGIKKMRIPESGVW